MKKLARFFPKYCLLDVSPPDIISTLPNTQYMGDISPKFLSLVLTHGNVAILRFFFFPLQEALTWNNIGLEKKLQ